MNLIAVKRERKGTHCFFSNGEGPVVRDESPEIQSHHLSLTSPTRKGARVPFLSRFTAI